MKRTLENRSQKIYSSRVENGKIDIQFSTLYKLFEQISKSELLFPSTIISK